MIRRIESFDRLITSQFNAKYASSGAIATGGRLGTCLRVGSGYGDCTFVLDSRGYWVLGFAYRAATDLDNQIFLEIRSTASVSLSVGRKASGHLYVSRSGATDIAVAGNIPATTWHYVEIKFVGGLGTGSYELRVDGVIVLLKTAINTLYATVNSFKFRGDWNYEARVDDLYVLDDQGSDHVTFLGDVTVEGLPVSGPASLAEWTPSPAVANYLNVQTGDGDTSRNESATVGAVDLYAAPQKANFVNSIKAVEVTTFLCKNDSGSRVLRTAAKISGTTVEGPDLALGTTYQPFVDHYGINPVTGLVWTNAEFFAAEFGVKVQS